VNDEDDSNDHAAYLRGFTDGTEDGCDPFQGGVDLAGPRAIGNDDLLRPSPWALSAAVYRCRRAARP
jgi:hypothetical protein